MPAVPFEAFFMSVDGTRPGHRFCIFHPAQGGATRGSVLYIHPFAEEMNKSRRMAAMQSRAFARAGYTVLQIDLLGCGDSSDDFGDASWQAWVDDVQRGANWLAERVRAPLWLWGLRAGCLLAVDAARNISPTPDFIFWAPTSSGKLLLQQFLRVKAAADMLEGSAKGAVAAMRQTLANGQPIDIAGYTLSAELANGLEQSALLPFDAPRGPTQPRIEWFEISTAGNAEPSPVVQKSIANWRDRGFAVHCDMIVGPSFWQTSEIEDAPGLVVATTAAISVRRQSQEAAA